MLSSFSHEQEIYSIDESFLGLRGTVEDLIALGHRIRSDVFRKVGVPVRVSIGRTKSLAKFASIGAKQAPEFDGVCHLGNFEPEQLNRIMRATPVTELWGVAQRTGKKLAALGIHTVADLRSANPEMIRKKFSVVLQRTVLELRGTPCIPLELTPRPRKDQLIYSRSFSQKITTRDQMQQVLSNYAQRVSGRLRAQNQVVSQLTVWAATSWADTGPSHSPSIAVALATPTDNPIWLGKAAQLLVPRLRPGMRYARAGVVLTGLTQKSTHAPLALFEDQFEGRKLGGTLDSVTRKFGDGAIGVGRAGLKRSAGWEMKRAMMSKRATTHWNELAIVRAA